jgi:hypothetical protein
MTTVVVVLVVVVVVVFVVVGGVVRRVVVFVVVGGLRVVVIGSWVLLEYFCDVIAVTFCGFVCGRGLGVLGFRVTCDVEP